MVYKCCGGYYKKIRAGSGRFSGMYEWQPMKRVLWFFIPDRTKRRFWLDDFGFEAKGEKIWRN